MTAAAEITPISTSTCGRDKMQSDTGGGEGRYGGRAGGRHEKHDRVVLSANSPVLLTACSPPLVHLSSALAKTLASRLWQKPQGDIPPQGNTSPVFPGPAPCPGPSHTYVCGVLVLISAALHEQALGRRCNQRHTNRTHACVRKCDTHANVRKRSAHANLHVITQRHPLSQHCHSFHACCSVA